MVLAILSFACEMIIITWINSVTTLGGQLTQEGAIGAIVMIVVCTIVSFITLFTNIKKVKEGIHKGKYITGIVFSAIGLGIGALFCFSCFAMLAAF